MGVGAAIVVCVRESRTHGSSMIRGEGRQDDQHCVSREVVASAVKSVCLSDEIERR